MSSPVRVLIADDHLIVREGLRFILETSDDIEVVGEAADGAQALRLAAELQPDVVLLDLRMPGMDGLTALDYFRREQPYVAIVILTTYNEDDLMRRGLRAGALGYLLKEDTDRQILCDTIHAAACGETLLKPGIVTRLLAPSGKTAASAALDLTDREREVLIAAARGERNKEIAARLGITERTVKAYLTSVYNKFGVDSRSAAIAVAAQRGLLPTGE